MQSPIPGEVEGRNAIEAVIEQIKAGDKQAYREIIIQSERQMYTYCYYILKNHAETQDAVREIFIRAYENIHQYSRQVSFSVWLYKIAYHHLIHMKKKQSRQLKLSEHNKEKQPVLHIFQHESVVYELLTYLTTEERHILLLKSAAHVTFDEISEIMDLNSVTVRIKYERLRRRLMELVSQTGEVTHGTFAEAN
ncbi:RNA polymerase sigma-70 factor, ECF subfamily [Paenibacillus uliginis N3/975]|uniref:RNA polymerase sigma-70 factor, ECF subfamily n=1 Tax=Paenibacillus uliginis N3/975 TaxID=1313296 RepID=A0A1X7HCH9_9BACL|nr:sigma-70 family RNA polymerase sigma factor [Paenibacillus uliginis]SMF83978.1 RNA polymerase sigma-70 factor, ECF subfamily [Paenibacillus uliginis N3/975]